MVRFAYPEQCKHQLNYVVHWAMNGHNARRLSYQENFPKYHYENHRTYSCYCGMALRFRSRMEDQTSLCNERLATVEVHLVISFVLWPVVKIDKKGPDQTGHAGRIRFA